VNTRLTWTSFAPIPTIIGAGTLVGILLPTIARSPIARRLIDMSDFCETNLTRLLFIVAIVFIRCCTHLSNRLRPLGMMALCPLCCSCGLATSSMFIVLILIERYRLESHWPYQLFALPFTLGPCFLPTPYILPLAILAMIPFSFPLFLLILFLRSLFITLLHL
jgi:hypothetical protein